MERSVTLALTGDVMFGRGIDQIFPHPGDPRLYEVSIRDARDYVALAERAHGPIPRQVDEAYVWGDALAALRATPPHARIVNLETSITTSENFSPKGINYRMNPTNIGCLAAASVDCCVLANNHVLDWGEAGLLETLDTLKRAGIPYAGAGRNAEEAATPAIIDVVSGHRIAVFAFGLESSGIPPSWNAGPRRPGVNTLPDIFAKTISGIVDRANAARRKGDLLVASIHWGSNWGYEIPLEHRVLAHELIDAAGFAIVHGHSSHHPLAIEIYRGRLILYGCGDFITDYEGIAGYEEYRNDLALLYLPELAVPSGSLMALSMRPFRMQNFRLNCASTAEAAWLQAMLDRESARFGTHAAGKSDGTLSAVW
jgi:poly-gamma-glutamate capsule biosynthesis protein CapA/YwtB (metallophosphatase superfamily)